MIGWLMTALGALLALGWVAIWLNSSPLLRRWLRFRQQMPYVRGPSIPASAGPSTDVSGPRR